MLELFQGFGLNPWSMCNIVFRGLKEHFPSCVGGFNTPLCHSSVSYREAGDVYHSPVVVIKHVCDRHRWGDSVGVPGWKNASVFQACLAVLCFHVRSQSGSVTLPSMLGNLECLLVSPNHVLLVSFDIFK